MSQRYERAYLDIVKEVSIRCAAEIHGLNHVTLSRYVKRRAETTQLQVRPPGYLNPNNRVFNPEQEGKLQAYLKSSCNLLWLEP